MYLAGNASGNEFVKGQCLIIMFFDSISQKLCQSVPTCQLPPLVRILFVATGLLALNLMLSSACIRALDVSLRAVKHACKKPPTPFRFKTARGKNSPKISSNVSR